MGKISIMPRGDGDWSIRVDGLSNVGAFFELHVDNQITLEVENGVLQQFKEDLDKLFPPKDEATIKSEDIKQPEDEYQAFASYISEAGPSKPVMDAFSAGYKLGAMAVREGRY